MRDMSPITKKDTVQAVAAEINKQEYPISVTEIERSNQIAGNESSNKRPKIRTVRVFSNDDNENFEIDEGDYFAVAKLVRNSRNVNDDSDELQAVIGMVTIRAEDKECRVVKLCVSEAYLKTL